MLRVIILSIVFRLFLFVFIFRLAAGVRRARLPVPCTTKLEFDVSKRWAHA